MYLQLELRGSTLIGVNDSIGVTSGLLSTIAYANASTDIINASYTLNGITQTTSLPITLVSPQVLTLITISGPTTIYSGDFGSYVVTAHFSNGVTTTPTGITWSLLTGVYDSISQAGVVTANATSGTHALLTNQVDQVLASYTDPTNSSNIQTATFAINLKVNAVVALSINGLTSVPSSSLNNYTATGTYADGSTGDVTSGTTFTSDIGSFSVNAYTAPQEIGAAATANLTATYVSFGNTVTGTLAVTVQEYVEPPLQIYYGTDQIYMGETSSSAITPADIQNLSNTLPTTDTNAYVYMGLTLGVYGYFAIPSTVAGAANVTFTNIANNAVGGWDGASWTDTDTSGAGPITVADTWNGTPFNWYLYRTDYSNTTATYVVSW